MTENSHRSILQRIAAGGVAPGVASSARSGGPAVSALRLEAARSVRGSFGLTAVIDICEASKPTLDDLEKEVVPEGLAVILNGPDGRLGLAVYSPELAISMLEWRLLVALATEAPPNRPLTATDGAVLADFLDPLLVRFGNVMRDEHGEDWAQGFVQGRRIEDPRHVPLTLAAGSYRAFRLGLRLGQGTRGGKVFIALPEPRKAAEIGKAAHGRPWPDALQAGVLGAELTLNAVLWRMRMPAAAIKRLKVGDLVQLPAAALVGVKLQGPGDVTVAEGRLGQVQGDRAVKINGADDAYPDHGMAQIGIGSGLGAAMGEPAADFPGGPMSLPQPDSDADSGEDGFPAAGMALGEGLDAGFGGLPGDGAEEEEPFDFAAAGMAPMAGLPDLP